jgi:acyl-CoA dehydrogenase
VSGELVGAFALAEGYGNPRADAIRARWQDGRLTADKWPVADLNVADLVVVAAVDERGEPTLALLSANAEGVERQPLDTLDPSRDHGRLRCRNAPAPRLGEASCGWGGIQTLLDKGAVLYAFEQLGGAQACLDMASAYAKERIAFGRPIGSFQAIKHKLADVYIATELARSNAYYGAWALQAGAPELGLAAAAARVAATEAFDLASRENIQTHGGMGFTWEMDCHLFYRRARVLALAVGSARYWRDRLVTLWAGRGDATFAAAA